jgi:hypothetical protein
MTGIRQQEQWRHAQCPLQLSNCEVVYQSQEQLKRPTCHPKIYGEKSLHPWYILPLLLTLKFLKIFNSVLYISFSIYIEKPCKQEQELSLSPLPFWLFLDLDKVFPQVLQWFAIAYTKEFYFRHSECSEESQTRPFAEFTLSAPNVLKLTNEGSRQT